MSFITEEVQQTAHVIKAVVCDICGKEIKVNSGQPEEDFLHVQKPWNEESRYFGVQHTFDVCASCYSDILVQFQVKIKQEKVRVVNI